MNKGSDLLVYPNELGLLTDLYQLTMGACYVGEGLADKPASFELFTRRLPSSYGYLIAAGLEQAIAYLEQFSFTTEQIDALRSTELFPQAPDSFWQRLEAARFSGDVWAVPEGTAVFANEPLLRIEAPLWQAQIVETYLLNTLNYQTLIATRAARLRDVAGPESILLEFGSRRAFSPQGSVWAARAAIAGGLNATSNVLAALKLGQKPSGTMAHALVMALAALDGGKDEAQDGGEDEAFRAFHRYFPGAPLLIDTYDPVAATQRLAAASRQGAEVPAVRLDSGDLVELSKIVRSHLPQTKVFASGDLDEHKIQALRNQQAPIDGYGLGTKLVTGAPVNGVYKLVEIDGIPVMKEAAEKSTYPGRKQIFRQLQAGQLVQDVLGLASETDGAANAKHSDGASKGEPLLTQVMHQGKRTMQTESLGAIAQRTAQSVQQLPPELRQLQQPASAPLVISKPLARLTEQTCRVVKTTNSDTGRLDHPGEMANTITPTSSPTDLPATH